jgi:hypothetical protein
MYALLLLSCAGLKMIFRKKKFFFAFLASFVFGYCQCSEKSRVSLTSLLPQFVPLRHSTSKESTFDEIGGFFHNFPTPKQNRSPLQTNLPMYVTEKYML